MFFRLLMESFRRQRRRKLLAGLAILLGTTAVTAMLALATTIGDRIHKELAVYGANIVVYPKVDLLDVKVGGVDVKPATGGAYLKEKRPRLKTISPKLTGVTGYHLLGQQHHRHQPMRPSDQHLQRSSVCTSEIIFI
jgi:putative ABC transport system permease protein